MKELKLLCNWHGKYYERPLEITRRPNKHFTWTQYQKLAQLTGKINFRCGFNKKGECKGTRDSREGDWIRGPKCCCANCGETLGYLKRISKAQANTIQKLWDKVTGFWREGKGCILPRRYRSPTCLTFLCNGVKKYPHKILGRIRNFLQGGRDGRDGKFVDFDVAMKDIKTGLQEARLIAPPKESVK